MGIGGVGMSALAVLLQHRGYAISGCDLKPTPRTEWLKTLGISVAYPHDRGHLEGVDELIVTPAVAKDEEELRAFSGPVRRRGEVLAELVSASRDSIAVCGSHGKTTTATYIARLLMALGEKVEWAIGGETASFPVAGGDKEGVLVVEADESDGTLAMYHAGTLVVTNVEYDHPDHFPTEESYRRCFDTARAQAKQVIEGGATNEETALKVALARGHRREDAERELKKFAAELPDRRFQLIAPQVYIDYAHHPTEIAYTLKRARGLTQGRILAMFQPHRYSRTAALKADFAEALKAADETVICPTYAAFESPVEDGDEADLYALCRERGQNVHLVQQVEAAWTYFRRTMGPDDLLLVLGAGDLIYKLKSLPPKRIVIGMGTNTWRSELDLGIEYVTTSGGANQAGAKFGIPFMAGIPGTLGGWVKMNAGAFEHSISEVVRRVKVNGRWLNKAECGFGYRTSTIDGEIEEVELDEDKVAELKTKESVEDYLKRRKTFPAGTYGSVFKNPEGDFAGRLLEAAGVKDKKVGGAYVWREHANVIVRGEDCIGSDVLALARMMRNAVYFRFGIVLESEVRGLI